MNEFSKRFKNLREARGITQDKAAEVLGISRSTIAGYESEEKNRVPREEVLNKIADYFHVTIDYLLGREAEKPPGEMSEMHRRLLSGFDSLSEEDKKYLVGLIERMPKNLN